MHLRSPAILAGGPAALELKDHDGRWARVTIRPAGEEVEFGFEARGAPAPVRPPHPEWHNRAHAVVHLDPPHDHVTRLQYAVDDTGAVAAAAHWAVPGEERGDYAPSPLDDPPPARGSFRPTGDHSFRATLTLPASVVWAGGTGPAGLALKVGFHEEIVPPPLVWPEPQAWWEADLPLGFGDLHRAPPAARVESIDVAAPAWGEPTELIVRGALGQGAPRSGQVRVTTVLPGDGEQEQPPASWRADGGRFEARPVVVFPHRGKWETRPATTAALRIAVTDAQGAALWTGSYPFGFDWGIVVRERYGPRGRELPARPRPSDPAFVEKFRRYVLARLPDYRAATTREGAASDFHLIDPAGEADLDLSASDWPERLAAMLAERFDRWDDALAAVAMWIYHPLVTRHSSIWSRVSGQVSVESIPRLGGCFCGDTARLGAMLAERLGQRLGVPLRGYAMGLRGHLATLVDSPAGRVVIDGMIGLWFHALDNTRLATLDEMRADPGIVDRMWYCPRRHGHEFFFGRDDQIIRPWRSGPVEFPSGWSGRAAAPGEQSDRR